MTQKQREFDIVIVGAGLSGLTAAYYLMQAGKRVAVLEARERIGGRIFSAETTNTKARFDLGPAWFWPHHSNVFAMLKQFGIAHFEQFEQGHAMYEAQAGEPQRFALPQQGLSYRIVGGVAALIDAFAGELSEQSVHLGKIVHAITSVADGSVVVETTNANAQENERTREEWRAEHVIVTLPPHLAASTIAYEPALSAELNAAMRNTPTWMGEAMKISLVYERPFWREVGLSGMGISYRGPVQQYHDATPIDEEVGALFGWVGNGGIGRTMQPSARRAAVIEQTVRLFGSQAANPIHYAELNWENEPFTTNRTAPDRRLATEHPRYGHPLMQPPQMNGRLWWATTEVAEREGGYLDGALLVGRTIAEKIVTA